MIGLRLLLILACKILALLCLVPFGLLSAAEINYQMPIRSAADDEITSLPGLETKPLFKQYSGYLNAGSRESDGIFLHYWLVESQSNPQTDPLVVWLGSGIIGCSNIMALLTELGPFQIGAKQNLRTNPNSWNRRANLLFIDTPVGVGYSYRPDHDSKVSNDDIIVEQNYLGLESFLSKFPEFKKNPLYLAGRHYAGIHLPLLGIKLEPDDDLNFKGLAIGNGYMDKSRNDAAMLFNGYYNGILSEAAWKLFTIECCRLELPPSRKNCDFSLVSDNQSCKNAILGAHKDIFDSGLNIYNADQPCTGDNRPNNYNSRPLKSQSALHEVSEGSNVTTEADEIFDPTCNSRESLLNYMRQKEVREALHIPDRLDFYKPCSYKINRSYRPIYPLKPDGLSRQVNQLLKSQRKLNLVFYNGDADLVCPLLGARWFVDELGAQLIQEHQPWYVDGQVAGFIRQFDQISFVTVRGAGQMVANDQPVEALELFEKYLLGLQ